MRTSARPRINPRNIAAAALLAVAGLASASAASAAPAPLASEQDVAAFAARIKAYAGATRVQWVVAARSSADASALVTDIGNHLSPADHELIARIKMQVLPGDTGGATPLGWMEPKIGERPGEQACSWQVWVSDPTIPSEDSPAPAVPLAAGDHVPVSPSATFRVGFTGLLQSKLYAFGETGLGDIRDLSKVPDANIPVAAGNDPETLVLVRARQAVPFLERIRSTLGDTAGERRDLGREFALRDNVIGKRRGIGANIQLVEPGMVIGNNAVEPVSTQSTSRSIGKTGNSDLMETCLFSLVPASDTP